MRISALTKSLWTPPAGTIVKIMAKYEYKDGEYRTYRRIDIKYDSIGLHDWVFGKMKHWYVDKTIVETIGLNPPGRSKEQRTRVYFETIAEAKQYIDEF